MNIKIKNRMVWGSPDLTIRELLSPKERLGSKSIDKKPQGVAQPGW